MKLVATFLAALLFWHPLNATEWKFYRVVEDQNLILSGAPNVWRVRTRRPKTTALPATALPSSLDLDPALEDDRLTAKAGYQFLLLQPTADKSWNIVRITQVRPAVVSGQELLLISIGEKSVRVAYDRDQDDLLCEKVKRSDYSPCGSQLAKDGRVDKDRVLKALKQVDHQLLAWPKR
jgi:hypothetical protein